jgi:hypothetical protein
MLPPDPHHDLARRRLTDLRHGLLRLHKILLDSEKLAYEQMYGQIASLGEFFQLVVNDEWFAWLHRLSELVVEIDEMLDAKEEPATAPEATRMIDRARLLLKPTEEGAEFGKRYWTAMQRDPDVVLAHAEAKRLLRKSVFPLN